MPSNGPLQGLPAPILSDPPDGPSQVAAANLATAERLNMRFVNTAARDAAIPNPVDGMETFIGTGSGAVKQIRHDGQWLTVVSGDTGWIAPTLKSGWVTGGTAAYIRRIGNLVMLRGYIQRSSGDVPTGYTDAVEIPAGMEPVDRMRFEAMGGNAMPLGWDVDGNLARAVRNSSTPGSSTWIALDGMAWWID